MATGTMSITLNGEPRELPAGVTVGALLAHCGLTPQGVAVEVNEVLVRRAHFDERRLAPGDRVEVVTLVGGG